ncbi:MAG TPA: hypothetical protein VHX38_23610 [Pseudonocardiaceae bacterium]|jgi:hypothetical protein|nr:hypothetical protein [Pseudonocardiaceae bacterium]
MHSLQQILDAYADAHGEALQIDYEQGDSAWSAPLPVWGSELPW